MSSYKSQNWKLFTTSASSLTILSFIQCLFRRLFQTKVESFPIFITFLYVRTLVHTLPFPQQLLRRTVHQSRHFPSEFGTRLQDVIAAESANRGEFETQLKSVQQSFTERVQAVAGNGSGDKTSQTASSSSASSICGTSSTLTTSSIPDPPFGSDHNIGGLNTPVHIGGDLIGAVGYGGSGDLLSGPSPSTSSSLSSSISSQSSLRALDPFSSGLAFSPQP